jgi:hypothetical protein
MPNIDPAKMKIGYVVLVAGRKPAIVQFQRKAGCKDSSVWTHVAGSLGGYTLIEASVPRSLLSDIRKKYTDKGITIKILKRRGQDGHKRYKVALWWATMNNLPYDALQFFWFPLSMVYGRIGAALHSFFSSRKRFICSELIATGFYKEGDYLFGKPSENVMPADFDDPRLFDEVKDIWQDGE